MRLCVSLREMRRLRRMNGGKREIEREEVTKKINGRMTSEQMMIINKRIALAGG